MSTPSPAAAAAFDSFMQAERRAWARVAGRLPGTPDYERGAWLAWVECVGRTDVARQRVQSEILVAHEQAAPAARPNTHRAAVPVSAPADRPSRESNHQDGDDDSDAAAPRSSRPVPLAEAAHATNLRFRTVLRQAGFQWSQFQTSLMRLGAQEFLGHSFIVTVMHAQSGMSRTYEAVHESGWLPEFQQDLEEGVFSPQ